MGPISSKYAEWLTSTEIDPDSDYFLYAFYVHFVQQSLPLPDWMRKEPVTIPRFRRFTKMNVPPAEWVVVDEPEIAVEDVRLWLWIVDNCEGGWGYGEFLRGNDYSLYFENPAEAVLFKLTWGGEQSASNEP
jgi:hypothetical protein